MPRRDTGEPLQTVPPKKSARAVKRAVGPKTKSTDEAEAEAQAGVRTGRQAESKVAAKAGNRTAAGVAARGATKIEKKRGELVILTGMSGSGKASALKAFEDLGYYSVDNLPLELIPRFADLVRQSAEIDRAALVVDVREGMRLDEFPQ